MVRLITNKEKPSRSSVLQRMFIPLIASLLILSNVGCSEPKNRTINPQSPSSADQKLPTSKVKFPLTILDSNGEEFTLEQPPQRIIAMDSSVVEILFAIGEGDRIAGTHDFVTYPPESAEIPRVGDAFNLNFEAILNLNPDLVFVFSPSVVPDLKRLGIETLYLKDLHQDFKEIPQTIRLWGEIVGNPEASEQLASQFEERIVRIEDRMEQIKTGPSVFQDEGEFWTPGPDTLIGSVFTLLKLRNIAFDISGYAQLSPEIIIERNPDIIISSYGDRISDNPAFSQVPAVRDNRIFVPQGDVLSVPGPRFILGVEKLANWIYPDLYSQSESPDTN